MKLEFSEIEFCFSKFLGILYKAIMADMKERKRKT